MICFHASVLTSRHLNIGGVTRTQSSTGAPQSMQSLLRAHAPNSDPGPPSSQSPSELKPQVLVHVDFTLLSD